MFCDEKYIYCTLSKHYNLGAESYINITECKEPATKFLQLLRYYGDYVQEQIAPGKIFQVIKNVYL